MVKISLIAMLNICNPYQQLLCLQSHLGSQYVDMYLNTVLRVDFSFCDDFRNIYTYLQPKLLLI